MSPDSSTALRLAALYAATFFGLGVQLPFLPVWLADRGFDASEIGLLLAIPMLARLLVSPWIAGLADGRAGAVRVLVVASLATLAAFAAMLATSPEESQRDLSAPVPSSVRSIGWLASMPL